MYKVIPSVVLKLYIIHTNKCTQIMKLDRCPTKLLATEISRRLDTRETFPVCLLFKNHNAVLFIFNQKTSSLQQEKNDNIYSVRGREDFISSLLTIYNSKIWWANRKDVAIYQGDSLLFCNNYSFQVWYFPLAKSTIPIPDADTQMSWSVLVRWL